MKERLDMLEGIERIQQLYSMTSYLRLWLFEINHETDYLVPKSRAQILSRNSTSKSSQKYTWHGFFTLQQQSFGTTPKIECLAKGTLVPLPRT